MTIPLPTEEMTSQPFYILNYCVIVFELSVLSQPMTSKAEPFVKYFVIMNIITNAEC